VSADVRRTIRGPLAQRLVSRGSLQLDKMTYPGCEKELPLNGPTIVQSRGLQFCCQAHAG